jgi:DNA-directed RNA polymerases I, II, and III subunit RPABC3
MIARMSSLQVYEGACGVQSMQSGKPSLMDKYEYVMYGKIFKYKDKQQGGQQKVEVTISFGGLLMQLSGEAKKLEELDLDSNVYLLMRKV